MWNFDLKFLLTYDEFFLKLLFLFFLLLVGNTHNLINHSICYHVNVVVRGSFGQDLITFCWSSISSVVGRGRRDAIYERVGFAFITNIRDICHSLILIVEWVDILNLILWAFISRAQGLSNLIMICAHPLDNPWWKIFALVERSQSLYTPCNQCRIIYCKERLWHWSYMT